jgi:hypothetical protein
MITGSRFDTFKLPQSLGRDQSEESDPTILGVHKKPRQRRLFFGFFSIAFDVF